MSDEIVTPAGASADLLRDLASAGIEVDACYQCGRCSAGCPVAPFSDLMPMEAVRLASWGMEEPLLASRQIWLCASCETCTTRCPNSVEIAALMDVLRRRSLASGRAPAEPRVPAFHQAFLDSVKRWGRTWELGMLGTYKLRSGDLWSDIGLGMRMFGQGKLHLVPRGIRAKAEVKGLFREPAAPGAGEGKEGKR